MGLVVCSFGRDVESHATDDHCDGAIWRRWRNAVDGVTDSHRAREGGGKVGCDAKRFDGCRAVADVEVELPGSSSVRHVLGDDGCNRKVI